MNHPARLQQHLETLATPRNPWRHRAGHQQAQSYLKSVLEAQGRSVQSLPFAAQPEGSGCNLWAPPIGQALEQPALLLVAHYDTVDDSPGADDNGSAVAVALEVAARCPGLGVLLTDLEEFGLQGARAYVRQAGGERPLVLVLESVGYFCEQPHSQRCPEALQRVFPQAYDWLEARCFRGDFLALLHRASESEAAQRLEAELDDCLRLCLPPWPVGTELPPALRDFGRSDHLAFWEAD